MATEMRTTRVRRTWLDKLLWQRAYETRIFDAHREVVGPRTEHEADVMALKLFCLLSFILVGLITAGVL